MIIDKEKMQEIIRKNGFAQLIGMELLEVREGFAKGRIPLEDRYTNIYGGMHGGCSYALADTLAGIAASTYGSFVTTIDGKINYLLPIRDTEYVYCEAQALRQGGKVGVYEARISNDSGEVLATADFTYYRLKEMIP